LSSNKQPIGKSVTAYLSLGSNLGDSKKNLDNAIKTLRESDEVEVRNCSAFYRSEGIDTECKNIFFNCVVEIETALDPLGLLDFLEEIETLNGRKWKGENKPRTLDIDIILYGGMAVLLPRLKVPHPKMVQRRFVLEPLAQIAPALLHPTLGQTPVELMGKVKNQVVIRD